MMRRVIVAVIFSLLAWAMAATVAGAQTYPPVPPSPEVAVRRAPVVVVVKGVPARQRPALSLTGTSSTLPLAGLALGSLVAGLTLVGVARRRRTAGLLSDSQTA